MTTIVRTERLRLRRFTESDVDNIWSLDGDAEVIRFLGDVASSRADVATRVLPRYLDESPPAHLAAETGDGGFVGWLGLRPVRPLDEAMAHWPDAEPGDTTVVELGYRLRKSAWGNGFATEAALGGMRYAFTELGAERIVATTMAVNTGSRRVLERAGLRYLRTRHLDWAEPLPGNEFGDVEYELTRRTWSRGRRRSERVGHANALTPSGHPQTARSK